MTYWEQATQEERLKQIDGGIECGMTSKQIAMCLRAPIYGRDGQDNAVKRFGNHHGRHFPTPPVTAGHRAGKSGGRISTAIKLRNAGWSDVSHKDAFSIFGTPEEPNPFASLSQHEFEA